MSTWVLLLISLCGFMGAILGLFTAVFGFLKALLSFLKQARELDKRSGEDPEGDEAAKIEPDENH